MRFTDFIRITLCAAVACSAQAQTRAVPAAPTAASVEAAANPAYDPTKPAADLAKSALDAIKPVPALIVPEVKRSARPSFLWQVKSPSGTLFLYGTIHVGKSTFYPLPDPVEAALSQSAKLVVEADISSDEGLGDLAAIIAYQAPDNLEKHLPPPLFARLKSQLAKLAIPLDTARSMKPFVLGGLLAVVEYSRLGYDMTQGVDGYLIKRAKADKKVVLELESQKGQLELLNGMPMDLQIAFLENALQTLERGSGAEQVTGMVNAWQSGDSKLLEEVAAEFNKGMKESARLDQILLEGRHAGMLQKIEQYLAGKETHFVAVGSLHLVGKGGLVQMLKSKGYEVTQK